MYNLLLYKTFILRSLITMLEDEGIVINPTSAVDIEKILANTDIEKLQHLSELKYKLCPLICRNKEEQAAAYTIFDKLDAKIAEEYKEKVSETTGTPILVEKKIKKVWKKLISPWYLKNVLTPACMILGILLLLYLFRNQIVPLETDSPNPAKKINIIASAQQVIINDTVNFSALVDSSLNRQNSIVDWKFPDTTINNSLSVTRVFTDTSAISVTAYLKTRDAVIIDSSNYSVTVLCEPPPSVAIDETDISAGGLKTANSNKKQFAPLFTNAVAGEKGYTYRWYVNDSLYAKSKVLVYNKPYNSIKLVVGCYPVHCSVDSLVAQTESLPALQAEVTGDGKLNIGKTYNWNNMLMSLLFLVLIPVAISFLAYRIILSLRDHTPGIEEPEPGTDGPYKITFSDQQHKINTEQDVRRLADVLRKRQVSDMYKLNFRKTIRSTVIAGGIPKLEFSPVTKPVSFLALIDHEKPDSLLVKLFEYLMERLRKDEVNIHVYEYFKEPLFLTSKRLNQERVPLQKLAALYPDSTLFIFGDARYFLYPLKGTVKSWVTNKLNSWPLKILLTQYAADDWDKKEKLLIESNFVVLPADLSSLPVIDKIVSGQIDIAAQKKETIESPYRSRFLNFHDFGTLKNYFGEGPTLQWVCCLAIYPSADWDFTIAIGKAIEQRLQQNAAQAELVNYTNLLKIGRISWMQDGIINESLRADMLAYLDKDTEVLARQTLTQMLHVIQDNIEDGSLIKGRFDIHKKLNQFLVDSYQHKKIEKEDEAFIQKTLLSNRLDEGQGIYLEHGNNSLLSHPFGRKEEVGLSRYFKLKKYRQIAYSAGYALAVLATLILVSFNLLKNNTAYTNWLTAKPVQQTYVLNINGEQVNREIQLNLYYTPAGDRSRGQQFRLANLNDTFRYDSIPIKDTNSFGRLLLSTADGRFIAEDSFKLNSEVYYIRITEVPKIPLQIYYRDASALTLANTVAENLTANFTITTQQQDLNDTAAATVYYFSTGYREDALKATAVLNDLLRINIQPRQVDVDTLNFPQTQASVVIYMNKLTADCTPLTVSALPRQLNEIWHGGTSNRLININLSKNVMYYAVNETSTFVIYGIDEICLTKSGTYKIITNTKQGYKLFFIKNVSSKSFDLSVCQNFVQSKAELQNKEESYCDRFNTMTWYYENDPNRIFLPVMSGTLATSEKRKLDRKSDSINNPLYETSVNEYQFPYYNTLRSDNRITQIFKNSNIVLRGFTKHDNNKTGNAFQRGYIDITIKPVKSDPKEPDPVKRDPKEPDPVTPDCRRTFYSLDETRKLSSPLIVCKLDLSKEGFKTIPKEIYEFTNLQELTFGTTAISTAEISQLQKALPTCRIVYETYKPDPPPVPTEEDLGYLYFDKKDRPTNASKTLMDRIGNILLKDRTTSIVLDAQYTDSYEQKKIENYMNQVISYFAKLGINEKSGQISKKVWAINTKNQQQQEQVPAQQNEGSVHITGINFPADFNQTKK